MYRASYALLAAGVSLALFGCNKSPVATNVQEANAENAAASATDHNDPVASAMSAAPSSISEGATIVQAQADGSMKTLREGTNGWTCMPDSPTTPGPDPMCMDANAKEWAMAWVGHKPPPTDRPGVMYMLAGGTDASNTDPYAKEPTQGSDWVSTGPHMMVVGSAALLKGYPSGAKPDTTAPRSANRLIIGVRMRLYRPASRPAPSVL